jgi:hypothetical protein
VPAEALAALKGDVAELRRAAEDDHFAEELRASGLVRRPSACGGHATWRRCASAGALEVGALGPHLAPCMLSAWRVCTMAGDGAPGLQARLGPGRLALTLP